MGFTYEQLTLIQAQKSAIAIYGQALTNPMIQLFFSHVPAAVQLSPESGMPNASPKVRFAPLDPV